MSYSINQMRELAVKSLENCNSLFFEAKLLHANGHYARALFLAKVAEEELGKHLMCGSALVKIKEGEFDVKKFNRRFRNHDEKNLNATAWGEIILGRFQNVEDSDFPEYNMSLIKRAKLMEKVRQYSLYVGFEEGIISNPAEIREEESSAFIDHLSSVLRYLDDGVFLEAIDSFE